MQTLHCHRRHHRPQAARNHRQDCCKSPIDMFADRHIPNDLAAVDAAICDFYSITEAA